jgi:redox-sensing transcriptional repressor
MAGSAISKKVLKRLPCYLDYLKSLPNDVENISATTIARKLELGEVQVRKDLACVSASGRQRTGRSKNQLIQDIEYHLNVASATAAVVVGVGNLGQALLEYKGFAAFGVNVLAGFDIQPDGKYSREGKPIYAMNRLRSFCQTRQVNIGIITVPADRAQEVCDHMVTCGIRAIWNFAPINLNVPDHVTVQNENLAVSLTSLRLQFVKQDQ